ncbi:MAG: TQO small subunit DoxD [Jatrophihabitantaceae bacterium]
MTQDGGVPITPPAPGSHSRWARRLTEPGWLLLPLRGFLGLTFSYAGLQKLANPDYLDPNSPTSVAAQMHALRHSSPIGPLVGLSAHAPTAFGLLIAFGELAVGLGTLLGLWPRIAAAAGAVLSLTFFLTVSWNTSPYYYGSDIVFVFAWSVLLGFGTGGVLSLDSWLRNRARSGLGLGPQPADVVISAVRLRALCGRGNQCGLQPDGICHRLRGCPTFPVDERLPPAKSAELDRRTVVQTGAAAALVAAGAALFGGATAALGRAAGGTHRRTAELAPPPGTGASAGPTPSTTSGPAGSTPAGTPSAATGTVVGTTDQVPVGQARQFTDPATGAQAWMVHPAGSSFVAFDATCTHAGCPVRYDQSTVRFSCPCHGGVYDARTGEVLQGPPPAPLRAIPVQVVSGQLRVGQ